MDRTEQLGEMAKSKIENRNSSSLIFERLPSCCSAERNPEKNHMEKFFVNFGRVVCLFLLFVFVFRWGVVFLLGFFLILPTHSSIPGTKLSQTQGCTCLRAGWGVILTRRDFVGPHSFQLDPL